MITGVPPAALTCDRRRGGRRAREPLDETAGPVLVGVVLFVVVGGGGGLT